MFFFFFLLFFLFFLFFFFFWCFSCFIFCFLTLVTSGVSLLTSRKLMTAQSQFGTYWIGENGDSRPQCLLKVLTYVLFWLMRRKAPGSRLRNCVYGTQRLKPPFMVNHDSNNGHCPRLLLFSFLINPLWFCKVHFSNIWYYALLSKKKIIKARANSGDFIIWLILHENPCFLFFLVNIITSSGHVSWGRLVHSFHQCLLIPTDITKDNLQRF